MMNYILKKTYSILFILLSIINFAQTVPPPPENPESGDIGAYPASPIDSYVFVLLAIAVIMIIAVVYNNKKKLA